MFSYTFQFFFQNSFDCYNSTDNSLYPSLHPNKRQNVQFWKDRFTYTFIGRSCISSFLLIIEFILPVPGASWEAAKSRPRLTACFKSDFNLKFDGSFLSLPRCFKMFSLAALLIIIFSRLAWLLFAADSIDLISSILSLMACASSAVVRGLPLVVADVRMRPPWKVERGLGAGVVNNPDT